MLVSVFFFCKQKTAYEMRISDWSSDVCSSDLVARQAGAPAVDGQDVGAVEAAQVEVGDAAPEEAGLRTDDSFHHHRLARADRLDGVAVAAAEGDVAGLAQAQHVADVAAHHHAVARLQHRLGQSHARSEEHTSELQSLMHTQYARLVL